MATQDVKANVKPHEDSGRGEIWTVEDTRHLISIWGDPSIQRKLRSIFRNNTVYDEICQRLREHGVYRTPAQCRNKTKNLRKGFRELKLGNGRCSRSVSRQSSLFFEELERVWGQDYQNNPGEFGGHEGEIFPTENKDGEDNGTLNDGCSIDGATLSDVEPREYDSGDTTQSHGPERVLAPHIYSPELHRTYTDRKRAESGATSLAALQQLNQENMERMKDTVLELNRSFLEQMSAAEERRERLSKEHEVRLFEMFLQNSSGRSSQSSKVYPVRLAHSDMQHHSNHDQPSQGSDQSVNRTMPDCHAANRPVGIEEGQYAKAERLSSQGQSAPGQPLRTPKVNSSSLRCLALRLHPGDEIKESLRRLADEKGIQAACILSCVGSVRCAELRLADSTTVVKLSTNHEIVSLVGTVSTAGMHLHASLADEEGKVVGGHVIGNMEVFTTAEILIGQLPQVVFKREMDKETGYHELVVEGNTDIS